jgi:N-methylhydantoinase A/oxoprolinase/acetone carboxylase beta subunit
LKGARTGLITTKGFRDVLEIRTLRMPRLYDLSWTKPPPLIERHLRAEVDERVNAQGVIERRAPGREGLGPNRDASGERRRLTRLQR